MAIRYTVLFRSSEMDPCRIPVCSLKPKIATVTKSNAVSRSANFKTTLELQLTLGWKDVSNSQVHDLFFLFVVCSQCCRTLVKLLGYDPMDKTRNEPGYGQGSGQPHVMYGFIKYLWISGRRDEAFSR